MSSLRLSSLLFALVANFHCSFLVLVAQAVLDPRLRDLTRQSIYSLLAFVEVFTLKSLRHAQPERNLPGKMHFPG